MRLVALLLAGFLAVLAPTPAAPPSAGVALAKAPIVKRLSVTVVDNHDGDTLTVKLDGGRTEKVRLIGVDTAEMAQGPWGAKARDYVRHLTKGKRVNLAFDVEPRDRYGRLLAYVYLPDGTFLNLALVRQGYAMVLTYPPNVAHTKAFVEAQAQARAERLNIWGASGLEQSPREFRRGDKRPATRGEGLKLASPAPGAATGRVSLNTRSKKYHQPGCRAYDCSHCEETTEAAARARGAEPCKLCH